MYLMVIRTGGWIRIRVAEVDGIAGVKRGVMGLLRLWKCVEKWGETVSSEWWVMIRKTEHEIRKSKYQRRRGVTHGLQENKR